MIEPGTRFLALVVLFGTPPSRSATLRSLAQQEDLNFDLLVWDNSEHACTKHERDWLRFTLPRSDYHHSPQNTPLARVYETVIRDRVLAGHASDYLLILDQDSTLPPAFLRCMRRSATMHPEVGLLLPLVRSADTLVSPATIRWFLGRRWSRPKTGLLPSRSMVAINSGMVLSRRYLAGHFNGYPQELTFYGTDNWMCQAYAEHLPTLVVVDTTIRHGLAEHEEEPIERRIWRHREIVRATRYLNRQGLLRRVACDLYLLAFSARKAGRFRDGRFLQWT